ncbi:GNAT family N-acetyltransferase [Lactococcus allomyrinae]|uniref:GNAT family N-acetyltransferase n=1 Tax=Lactococcus allomyrinae TaxID=2419773 RepID=A0A387BHH4_9LACT|nr:GNAT family N-acetyltransferase [Lactococcus allomyrinae]AYG00566.1 GNAT family N-acetyltransferase [Lactococcus allomyrinae]
MNFSLKILSEHHKAEIEVFFEQASDYAILESGFSNPQSEAMNLLHDFPDGKVEQDKFVYGVFSQTNELVGVVDLIKDFPENNEWMLGLLDFIPSVRHQGLGKEVHQLLVEQVKSAGGKSLRIGVLHKNTTALRFWKGLGYQKFKEVMMTFGAKIQKVDVMRLKV